MGFEITARIFATCGWATPQEHAERISELITELTSLEDIELAPADELCSAISLNLTEARLEYPELETESGRIKINVPQALFVITADIDVNPDCLFRDRWVHHQSREGVACAAAIHRLDEALAALALSVYLAYPDEIHFFEPTFTPKPADGFTSAVAWGGLRRGVVIAKEIGWPPLQRLTVRSVQGWLREDPGWREGIGREPVGRAVAALSQAISLDKSSTTGLSLLWAMVGLEALYCRGREGLKAQLTQKSQLLLGASKTHKKRFGQVYDYRSSFIHGGEDLPFAHRERSEDEDVWQYIWRSDDEAGLAVVTLLASIQELIARDWHRLEYEVSILAPTRA